MTVSTCLSRHGRADPVIGMPITARSFTGAEPLLGPLINTLPLRLPVDEAQSFRAHLARVAGICEDAYRHGDYPFDRLVADLDIERDPAPHPVFQILGVRAGRAGGLDTIRFGCHDAGGDRLGAGSL